MINIVLAALGLSWVIFSLSNLLRDIWKSSPNLKTSLIANSLIIALGGLEVVINLLNLFKTGNLVVAAISLILLGAAFTVHSKLEASKTEVFLAC